MEVTGIGYRVSKFIWYSNVSEKGENKSICSPSYCIKTILDGCVKNRIGHDIFFFVKEIDLNCTRFSVAVLHVVVAVLEHLVFKLTSQ